MQKKAICKPCVAMLYAENGDVNRRAPYLCRFSDCLIAEMKKELVNADSIRGAQERGYNGQKV